MAEIRAGVYVGVYSARTRERIWSEVLELIGDGSAAIAWSAPTDSGFAFETIGHNRRYPIDFDGLTLVEFRVAEDPPIES
jgi:CRISPR-associated protein Cas2